MKNQAEKVKTPSVLFNGYVFSATGYGTAARAYVHAFHRANIGLSVIDRAHEQCRNIPDPLVDSLLNRPLDVDFCVCHTEPLDFASMRPAFSHLIALTTWESDTLPADFANVLNEVREIWTPSSYNAEAFRKQLKAPVFHLPHPVHVPPPTIPESQEIENFFNLKKDDFVFLNVATWQERKNIPATIEAFFRAFPREPNIKLFIKTSFYFTDAQKANAQVVKALKRAGVSLTPREIDARLKIFQVPWTEELMATLMRRADCYVALHRSEGWCYPLFDAACAGIPVITTAYSGPMDYLDPKFHHLVNYKLVHATRGDDPESFRFSPEMLWADPDILHAAAQMRVICNNKQKARKLAETGAALLREKYSFESVGNMARKRLQQLAQKD
jgi:glycosyltransferase involved in cell wall biosynthesis